MKTSIDLATHNECVGFIRTAISEADRQTAQDIAGILKDCYQRGYVDRAEIWAALSDAQKQQFQRLLASPPIVPMVHWNVGDRV